MYHACYEVSCLVLKMTSVTSSPEDRDDFRTCTPDIRPIQNVMCLGLLIWWIYNDRHSAILSVHISRWLNIVGLLWWGEGYLFLGGAPFSRVTPSGGVLARRSVIGRQLRRLLLFARQIACCLQILQQLVLDKPFDFWKRHVASCSWKSNGQERRCKGGI